MGTEALRHACGYQLANRGVDTRSLQAHLGHRNITRFKNFWHDCSRPTTLPKCLVTTTAASS
jgi:site-specific recombinase XerD